MRWPEPDLVVWVTFRDGRGYRCRPPASPHGGSECPQMTVLLHLGFHKTGTTALQQTCRALSDELSAEGWAYQGRRVGPITDAMQRVHAFRREPRGTDRQAVVTTFRAAVEGLLERGRHVFISDEMLLGHPLLHRGKGPYPEAEHGIGVIADALRDLDVEVVLSMRRQPEFVESVYVQSVQEGRAITFPAFCDDLDPSTLGWSGVIEQVAEAIAAPTVVPYEHLLTHDGGLVAWFLGRLDVDVDTSDVPRHHNVSFSERALFAALGAYPALGDDDRQALRRHLQRSAGTDRSRRPRLLTPAGRRQFLEPVAGDNGVVFDRYVDSRAGGASRAHYCEVGAASDREGPAIDPVWQRIDATWNEWSAALVEWSRDDHE